MSTKQQVWEVFGERMREKRAQGTKSSFLHDTKNTKSKDSQNCRGITVLSVIAKVYERVKESKLTKKISHELTRLAKRLYKRT